MRIEIPCIALATLIAVGGCGGGTSSSTPQTGGSTSTGGKAQSTGGSSATGGNSSTGGNTSTGGVLSTGGVSTGGIATGGITNTGGTVRTGGTATGGTSASGGQTWTGGTTTQTGGSSSPDAAVATGGSTGSGGAGSGGTVGTGGRTDAGTATGGSPATGGTTGAGGGAPLGTLPCDIYAAASSPTPCVGAYSMARVIYSKYSGPLYQLRKGGTWDKKAGPSGGTTLDVGVVDGIADAAAQDTFCEGATCTVSILYDQSGKANHLKAAPPGCYTGGDGAAAEYDKEAVATRRPTTINGKKVYALQTVSHDGYRNNKTTGMVTGSQAQGIYMVADGKKAGNSCCWDFGNAMPSNCADGTGSMNALWLGGGGLFGKGVAPGPWFMGDFEFGVWAGGSAAVSTGYTNPNLPSMNTTEFAFGVLKTSTQGTTGQYCIRAGNGAAGGGNLTTAWDGQAPKPWHLGGAIILGIGGDNSNWSYGTFFEGAVTFGRPSDDTDAKVLANVQAAGYGK